MKYRKPAVIMAAFMLIGTVAGCGGSIAADSVATAETFELIEASIEPELIYNDGYYKINVMGLEYSGGEITVGIAFENKTGEDISVSVQDECMVNGYTVPAECSIEVPAGETVEGEIVLAEEDLESCGITEVNEFGVSFYGTGGSEVLLDTDVIIVYTDLYDES